MELAEAAEPVDSRDLDGVEVDKEEIVIGNGCVRGLGQDRFPVGLDAAGEGLKSRGGWVVVEGAGRLEPGRGRRPLCGDGTAGQAGEQGGKKGQVRSSHAETLTIRDGWTRPKRIRRTLGPEAIGRRPKG